jgi:hypothetical protein
MNVGRRGIPVENKALLLLTAVPSMKERLIEESTQFATALFQRMEADAKTITVMTRIARDPFVLTSKLAGHDVTIELRADAELAAFTHALSGARNDVPSASADPAGTVVLIGSDHWFRPCPPQAVRFQYLMPRRPDLTHEAFTRHYGEVHSEFGYKTLGVKGYAQFHVDPLASDEAVRLSGLGTHNFDGVSQLYMPTLTKFLLASPLNGARGMVKDEKRFVDRNNSIMFASRVVTSLGRLTPTLTRGE